MTNHPCIKNSVYDHSPLSSRFFPFDVQTNKKAFLVPNENPNEQKEHFKKHYKVLINTYKRCKSFQLLNVSICQLLISLQM